MKVFSSVKVAFELEKSHLNDEDMRIITNITTTIVLEMNDCIEHSQDNNLHDLATEFMNIMLTQKNLARSVIILDIDEYADKNGLVPNDINKKIARFLKKESEYYAKKPTISKSLDKSEKDGVSQEVRGKLNIKGEFPELHSPGRGRSEKRAGFPIRYKITDKVKDYKRILNDPKALELINQNLSAYNDLLGRFYRIVSNYILNLIVEHGNPIIYKFFSMPMRSLNAKIPTESDWILFRDGLSKLSDEERQRHINEMTTAFLKNPQSLLFFFFSLTQKKYDGK